MANPFLVLGGIAVGIITAAFGVLQVPGWVASAQDASAINDLRMISEAQAASASLKGEYAGELSALRDGSLGLTFTVPTDRVKHFTADADGWCSIAASDSGRFFGVTESQTEAISAATLDAAIAAACGAGASGSDEPEVPTEPATVVSATVKVGSYVNDMDFSPDSKSAYLAHQGANGVSVVNVATNSITNLPLEMTALRVDVSPDGALLAVGNRGPSYTGSITIYDTGDLSVVATMTTRGLRDLTWTADGTMLAIAPETGPVNFISRSTWATAASVGYTGGDIGVRLAPLSGNKVLLKNTELHIVDPAEASAKKVYDHSSQGVGATVATDGAIWFGLNGDVLEMDPETFAVRGTQRVTEAPATRSMTASSDGRWVYHLGSTEVSVLDTGTRQVVAKTPVNANTDIHLTSDGKYAYTIKTSDAEGTITVLTTGR